MSEEFIREVDEDLKEEKRLKLWKQILPYVISISLGVILTTTGFVFWDSYALTELNNNWVMILLLQLNLQKKKILMQH